MKKQFLKPSWIAISVIWLQLWFVNHVYAIEFDFDKHITNFSIDKLQRTAKFSILVYHEIGSGDDDNLLLADISIGGSNYFKIVCQELANDDPTLANDYNTAEQNISLFGQTEDTWGIKLIDGKVVRMNTRTIGDFTYMDFDIELLEADWYKHDYILSFKQIYFEDDGDDYNHLGMDKPAVPGWPAITIKDPIASNDLCNQVNLSWTISSGYGPDIYYDIKENGVSVAKLQNVTSYTRQLSKPEGKDYNYEIEAGIGPGLYYSSSSKVTVVGGPPHSGYNDVSSFSVTNHTCDKIELTWDDASSGDKTKSYELTWVGGDTKIFYKGTGAYTFTNPQAQNYSFTLKSRNECDFATAGKTATAGLITLTAPTNLSATVETSGAIKLSWTAGGGQSKYMIKKTYLGGSEIIDNIDAGATSYTDENVSLCITYTYEIYAKNKCNTDGVYGSKVQKRVEPSLSNTFETGDLKISKGYYNDKVKLEWTPSNNAAVVESYEIYRRIYESGDDMLMVDAIEGGTTMYADVNADVNVVYEYEIVGVATCEGERLETNKANDIGFKVANGIVSGTVSFANGAGVKNVIVVAETEDNFGGKSLSLNSSSSNVKITHQSGFDFSSNFTFQAWVKPTASGTVFSKGSQYKIDYSNGQIQFQAGSQTVSLNFPQKQDTFFCINAVRASDSLYLYVVYDELTYFKQSVVFSGSTPSNTSDMYIGAASGAMTGLVEEVRVWNKAITGNDLIYSCIRYIAGSESELKAYYRLNEMFNNTVYDISRNGAKFNENHGTVSGGTLSATIPFTRQLWVKGVTDANGNYLIAGIPYTFGSIYKIVPIFEVHEFDPIQKQLFIGPGSVTHNGVDFVDIAAFKVTGNVVYRDTYFPVEGASLYIDGQLVVQSNGMPVMTDNVGNYEVYVPIGWHYVEVKKQGHAFVDAGRYPETDKWNFQKPISNLNFTDTTLIKVVGRVVGGPREAAKPFGLGKTLNNIGFAEIKMTTQREYDLATATVNATWQNDMYENDVVANKGATNYKIDALSPKSIKIYPDHTTGEFFAYLLPEKYVITDVKAGSYVFGDSYKTVVDLSSSFAQQTKIDSVVVGLTNANGQQVPIYSIDSVNYQYSLDLIYREIPSVKITNDKNEDAFWESTFTTNDGKTFSIVNADKSPKTLFPVFKQRGRYNLKISVYELYKNADNNNAEDLVPVSDGLVEIQNFLATSTDKQTFTINDNGIVNYSFTGGLPNTSTGGIGDYVKTLTVVARTGKNNAINTEWKYNGGAFKAYLLGGMPTGNNFVTTGPKKIEMILRDPPGSNSYSYFEKGESVATSTTYSIENAESGEANLKVQYGATQKTFQGVGAGTIIEVDIEKSVEIGLEHSNTWVDENTTSHVTTTTQRWSTSASEDYVGSNGDVFIGYSTNIVYGVSDFITFVPINTGSGHVGPDVSGYKIGKDTYLRVNPEFGTGFQYTKSHIENTLIPNLIALRNNLLTRTNGYYRCVNCDTQNPRYGMDNTKGTATSNGVADGDSYNYTIPPSWPDDSLFVDSVRFYNQQVRLWKRILAINEQDKLEAKLDKNISFDAGVVYENTVTYDTTETSNDSYEWQVSPSLQWNTGAAFNKLGAMVSLKESYSRKQTKITGEEETKSVTFGYVLEDGNSGDYFSIDLKKSNMQFGPVFNLRGGQTMCPYEGDEYTMYYNEGTILNEATMRRQVPAITCETPIQTDVQEDDAALFNIQIANKSETNEDMWMLLRVDETSNQDGALIQLDGSPINDGRLLLLPAGQSINKTISVTKIQPSVYDYENIALVLQSACEYDYEKQESTDTVKITAYFKPVCTGVNLSSPDNLWTINTNGDTLLNVQIKDYNLQHSSFEKILFQYKSTATSNWTTDMTFYVNQSDYNLASEPKTYINNQASLQYAFNMKSLQDRNYDIRVKSVCADGTENNSDVATGIKDVKRPQVFGSPQPASGILTPSDDVMITFDEPIQAGILTPYNFSVRGVLNGFPIKHETALFFDGTNDYASVVSGPNMENTNFTIEFWARRGALTPGVMYAQNGLELGFDANNKFYFKVGGQIITSNSVFDKATDLETWYHFAVSYDVVADVFNMYINDIIERESVPRTSPFQANGKMYIGRNNAATMFFNGYMHDLRIWEKALGFATVYANMYQPMNGNEVALAGCWTMNDAAGNIASDIARNHHAFLFGAEWRVFPSGFARTFNGSSDYVNITTGSTVVINNEMDFTLEFYFKADKQTNTVLFSNGKGDGSDKAPKFDVIWNIGINAKGELYAKNNGVIITVAEKDFLDNQWHHFALVKNVQANTSIYVDGAVEAYGKSSDFGGITGAGMTIGARRKNNSGTSTYDQYFEGSIDELRIWELARTTKQLLMDKNSKLKGDEMGLAAYYPFDKYNALGSALIETLDDISHANNPSTAVNGSASNVDVPNIKDARPVQNLDFDWVVNQDKIIINVNEQPSAIEKTILEFTVRNVEDLRENRISSPVTWTAYIKQNTVIWDATELFFEKELYSQLSFDVKIVNLGGNVQNYTISNLPAWLTTDEPTGSLEPDSYKIVHFTVNEGTNIGDYVSSLNLTSDFGYDEKLNINLKVYKQSPTWTVNPDNYQYSMSVIGLLKIDDVASTNPDDMVAAFVGNECRGVARCEYVVEYDMFQVFMNIYSNIESGDSIKLYVWEAGKGRIHTEVTPNYVFASNELHGTPSQPDVISANTVYLEKIDLPKGWKWFSLNLASDSLADANLLFTKIQAQNGDIVKGKTVYDQYNEAFGWAGSLTGSGGFKNDQMYMMRLSNAAPLIYTGKKIKTEDMPIAINTGWNWLSYVPMVNMTVEDAFGFYTPANGDVLKSQYEFAVYDQNLGWIGSLQFMRPTEGYLYKTSNAAGTLIYPEQGLVKNAPVNNNPYTNITVAGWKLQPENYQHNVSLVATTDMPLFDNYILGAFANDQCRGIINPTYNPLTNKWLYFITIYGNTNNDDISFKIINTQTNEVYNMNENVLFEPNATVGTLENPFRLSLANTTTDIAQIENGYFISAYNNPFVDNLNISFGIQHPDNVKISIYNQLGIEVMVCVDQQFSDGIHYVDLGKKQDNIAQLAAGVYYVKMESARFTRTIKVVKADK